MGKIFKIPSKRMVIGIAIALLILPITWVLVHCCGIVLTYTGSLPPGFYKIVKQSQSIKHGDIISFCLPRRVAKIGLERGYIEEGRCPGGATPLLKEVIAIPGDNIKITDNEVIVNGMPYMTPTDQRDHNGLKVTRLVKNGYYKVTPYYWVYGYGSIKYSWDSRYYGGIPKVNITHRLVPLLTF